MTKLSELEEIGKASPVIQDDQAQVSYIYVQYSNLYLLALTRTNVNAVAVLAFLHKLIEIFKHYFREVRRRIGPACLSLTHNHHHQLHLQLEEESLRDNFVIAYELLDEVMDFGYPQFTEAQILSEYIKVDAYKMAVQARPPMAVTNAVSWRTEGLFYKKNEVFLDVVESVNLLVNSNGTVVRSEVVGALKMRTYLSGMPECKLGLNDKVLFEAQGRAGRQKSVDLEDMKFHQCVRLASFERDRTISFIPPDGAFDLMTYRLSQNIKPLIWVECQVEKHSRSRTEYLVKARSQFKERSAATSVEILLPLPADAITPVVRTSQVSSISFLFGRVYVPVILLLRHTQPSLYTTSYCPCPFFRCRDLLPMLLRRMRSCGRLRISLAVKNFCCDANLVCPRWKLKRNQEGACRQLK